MKKTALQHIGIGLVALGTAILAILHLLQFTFINILLLLPLGIIIVGAMLFVRGQKGGSAY